VSSNTEATLHHRSRSMKRTSELSPENQLLLRVARPTINEDTSQKIRLLLNRGDLDWDYLLTAAHAHAVGPLLANHLRAVGDERLPTAVVAELRARNQQYTEQNLFHAGQLAKIVTALDAAHIPCLAFKGPTLALIAYGDLTLRQFADLDILVHPSDMPRVRETLTREGFVAFSALDRGREAALLRFDNAFAFINDTEVIVDAHWRFTPLYCSLLGKTDEFWERAQAVQIGDRTVMTLSAEDLLLVLCCHGFTHQWERLVWICDLASLVDRCNLDWDYAFRQAKRMGVLRIVLAGLALARELGATLTADVKKRLESDRVAGTFARQIARQVLEPQRNELGILQSSTSQISMRERIRDKLTALFHLIFTPRQYDWAFASLPPSLWFLYYPIRPIRMIRTRLRTNNRTREHAALKS
jgi:Uncharacterised nucleotidyltransferase